MNGPGHAMPPHPASRTTVIAIRLGLIVLGVILAFTLCWVPLLRLALLRRTRRDWLLCVASFLVLTTGATLTIVGAETKLASAGGGMLLIGGVLSLVYYIYGDVQHHGALRAANPAAVNPPAVNPPAVNPLAPGAPAYAPYAPPAAPYAAAPPDIHHAVTQYQHQPPFAHRHQAPPQPAPAPQPYQTPTAPAPAPAPAQPAYRPRHARPQHTPPPSPPARPPAPAPSRPRIDEVRAELDELSDLLRREPRDRKEQHG
ncbi:hypothetical protein [Streptomyces sp. NPDC053048]|uniref:hypothetical protein n=1 Tax=Streptomyces sp. NPDC053048 TaxID=3365694 RepID=UPI0037CE1FDA